MDKLYLRLAILFIWFTFLVGIFGILCYIFPSFLVSFGGFKVLRPLHVSAALFWILSGAQSGVIYALKQTHKNAFQTKLSKIQFALWVLGILGAFISLLFQKFGGREYWEFPPYFSLPLLISWGLFSYQVIKIIRKQKSWPTYYWMWLSGCLFFSYIFIENYLWLFPWFRQYFINDLIIQWKVNGSMVGAWNQLIYGIAFYLMDKISETKITGSSKLSFIMFILGFSNLCFNWAHHFYTLPGHQWLRWLGYLVSMTEWVIFIKIIIDWKSKFLPNQALQNKLGYKFLMAMEYWVFINLFQALLMSIPALNLYTHGTHITVAHAMGTTIGINSMILLALICEVFDAKGIYTYKQMKYWFWAIQIGLFLLWASLLLAGLVKGYWQMSAEREEFSKLMQHLRPYFIGVLAGGILLSAAITRITIYYFKK
jgi:nitric oxide reductase subunit B